MALCLGIDVGGSAARWNLARAGKPPRGGAAAGFSGHLYRRDIEAAAERSLRAIAASVGPVDAVVAGVTGLTALTPEADALRGMIASIFGAARVAVMSDSRLAYLAAFAPGAGILVYAGTGSVAAHVAADRSMTRVGGRGVVIDDAGGGYWIAVQALRSLLRREDSEPGSAWETPLGRALAARLGGSDWPMVRQAVYGSDRGGIGALAVAVGEAAAAGDAIATQILASAGEELALLALAAERRVGPLPLALAGRAASLHPSLFASFKGVLGGRAATLLDLDAAAGAARLAASQAFWEEQNDGAPH